MDIDLIPSATEERLVDGGELVPTITNKFRVRYSLVQTNLSTVGVYETLYTRSGKGLFFGFQAVIIANDHGHIAKSGTDKTGKRELWSRVKKISPYKAQKRAEHLNYLKGI